MAFQIPFLPRVGNGLLEGGADSISFTSQTTNYPNLHPDLQQLHRKWSFLIQLRSARHIKVGFLTVSIEFCTQSLKN